MTRLIPALLILAGCGYEPPLRPKDDPRIRPIPNGMSGSISLVGPEEPAPTVVLIFDNDFPGPPVGVDEPVDFASISPTEYSYAGTLGDTGMTDLGWHAEWSASELPDGAYQVEAIVDMDGDFSPGAGVLGGATCGDWQGFYERDPGSGVKGAVGVEGGQFLEGVAVTVRDELTTERPAFRFAGDTGYQRISLQAAGASATGINYDLFSTGVHVTFESGDGDPIPFDLADPCATDGATPPNCVPETTCEGAFSVWYPDRNGDGAMDLHPDFGEDFNLKETWPKVLVQFMGTPELDGNGEPVRDENGYPVFTPFESEDGSFWATENFTYGQNSVFGIAMVPVGVPTKQPAISVTFPPLVAKFYPPEHPFCEGVVGDCFELFDLSIPEQRDQVPRGVWSLNLVSWTGQVWTQPNEIAEWGVPSSVEGFDSKSQGGFILTVD